MFFTRMRFWIGTGIRANVKIANTIETQNKPIIPLRRVGLLKMTSFLGYPAEGGHSRYK